MKLLSLALVLVYVVACAPHAPPGILMPTVIRADTRHFVGFRFTTRTVVNRALQIVRAAWPNETAMCLYGFAQDTIYLTPQFMNPLDSVRVDKKIAIIDSVTAANVEKTGTNFVTYIDGVACDPNERLIAVAHSHPMPQFGNCDHSDTDAIFQHAKEQKYWFSLVFCYNSNSIMWADGRRIIFGYRKSKNNSNSKSGGVDNYLLDDYIKMMENMLNFN